MQARIPLMVVLLSLVAGLSASGAPPVARLAKVEVAWRQPEPLSEAHQWLRFPEALKNAQVYTKTSPDCPADFPKRELHFTVEERGFVFVAASWAYDGNTQGGWKETSWTEAKFAATGWLRVASTVRSVDRGSRQDEYIIFCRAFDKGAKVQIHTRKYGPPLFVEPTPEQAAVLIRAAGGRIPPALASIPEEATSRATATPKATPGEKPLAPLANAPSVRLAVPSQAEQAAAKLLIEELYADKLRERSAALRFELARQLLEESQQERLEPAQRYELLRIAGDLFASVGNATGAVQTARALSQSFELDALATCQEMLTRTLPNATQPERAVGLAEACLELLGEVRLPNDLEAAVKLAELAETASVRARRPELRTQARLQVKQLGGYHEEYQRVAPALEKLGTNPDDAEANLVVGQFRCFREQNWETGLPLLVKGSDRTLSLMASDDLAGPNATRDEVELGDQWRQRAEKESELVRTGMLQRAAHWYKLAIPQASGLKRALLEKRLGEIESGTSTGKR